MSNQTKLGFEVPESFDPAVQKLSDNFKLLDGLIQEREGITYGEYKIVAPMMVDRDPETGAMLLDKKGPYLMCQTLDGQIYFEALIKTID